MGAMFSPEIILDTPFRFGDIEIEAVQSDWAVPADYDQAVDRIWSQKQQEARAGGYAIWDGTLYRVANVSEVAGRQEAITLRLGTIPYRYVASYPLLQDQYRHWKLPPSHHLSTAAVIRTRDGQYVFGRRSRNGTIDLIGGSAQRDELEIAAGIDLQRNVTKEIREEIGVEASAIGDVVGIGILASTTSNILLIARVETALSVDDIEAGFAGREDDEIGSLVFVAPNELAEFLHGLADYRALIPELPGFHWTTAT
jgi:8-oxo-dGTP pyrophosphatase MutT (NUDIX family)